VLALNRASRRALAGAAVMAYAAAFALVPAEVGSRLSPPPSPAAIERPAPIPLPVVAERDPFVARAPDEPDVPPFVPRVPELAGLRPLPPNAGAGVLPFGTRRGALRVLAVVTGPNPSALIEDHDHSRLVAAGDALDGSRITAIDGGGIVLEDGRRLGLRSASEAVRP
jgi:hypothetical protein